MSPPADAFAVWRRPLLGYRQLTVGAVSLGVGLSALVIVLVVAQDHRGIAAALAAVTMTAPVVFARFAPLAAGLTLVAAAGLNEVFFGHLVRCGATLPASFYVAFAAGYVLGRRGLPAAAATAASLVLQCVYDPRLGAPIAAVMVPVGAVFFGAGWYLRRRATMTAALRSYTVQLRDQRDRTAQVAVAADREALTAQLNVSLVRQIDAIAEATRSGGSDRDRFASIEQLGRQTLNAMRELLGSLHDAPVRPEPGLADLADVCAQATAADVRLQVDGAVRPLPASIELSVCRIVEQLLQVLTDEPASRVQLRLDFAVTGLDIGVSGAPTPDADLPHVRALAGARAALHGGTVDITDRSGRRQARVWLPLITAHG